MGRSAGPKKKTIKRSYAVEQLYVDQEKELVIDAVPALLAWLPVGGNAPYVFVVETEIERVELDVTWDVSALEKHDPGVSEHATRMANGRTAQREHVTELAAYVLALVAISVLMPGRRVVDWRKGAAPDLLFDVNPKALRGVEVAGRTSGGLGALRAVRLGQAAVAARRAKGHRKRRKHRSAIDGKSSQLRARRDIVEAHLSTWCCRPRVSELLQVKP